MKRRVLWVLLTAALGLLPVACRRQPPDSRGSGHREVQPNGQPPAKQPHPEGKLPDFAVDAVRTQDGEAIWYDVPEGSLPQRRAWPGEMTAASDVLPMNKYVRVRRLDGKETKPVVVRVTDNGVHRKGVLIEVDRDAAEALGMVGAGEIKVHVETLALKNATADKPVDKKDAPTPAKASEISGTPAASANAEKAAADAKGTR